MSHPITNRSAVQEHQVLVKIAIKGDVGIFKYSAVDTIRTLSQLLTAQGCKLASSFCAETFGYATSSVPTLRRVIDCTLLHRPKGSGDIITNVITKRII